LKAALRKRHNPEVDAMQRSPRKGGLISLLRSEGGQTIVETAITLSLLCTVLFGIMEVCLAYYTYEMIEESAREGSRYAMVRGTTCVTGSGSSCTVTHTQVETYVNNLGYPNLGGGTMSVVASYPQGNEAPGSTVQVQITYTFPYQIPFVTNTNVTLTSTSVEPIIQ
jgi:Flp pilus assembly protein TadG